MADNFNEPLGVFIPEGMLFEEDPRGLLTEPLEATMGSMMIGSCGVKFTLVFGFLICSESAGGRTWMCDFLRSAGFTGDEEEVAARVMGRADENRLD